MCFMISPKKDPLTLGKGGKIAFPSPLEVSLIEPFVTSPHLRSFVPPHMGSVRSYFAPPYLMFHVLAFSFSFWKIFF